MTKSLDETFPSYVATERAERSVGTTALGAVSLVRHASVGALPEWKSAFSGLRKDRRYYEILEQTICPDFDYRYLVIRDDESRILAVQPAFVLDQDMVQGIPPRLAKPVALIRRVWPRFLTIRTMMVGCVAGEGHLAVASEARKREAAEVLARHVGTLARKEGVSLVVAKEFTPEDRPALTALARSGFTRLPSMPMTRLDLPFSNFEGYLKSLKSATRKTLKKKFAAAEAAGPFDVEVVTDISPVLAEIYPLYRAVYERSPFKFEMLTEAYFARLSERMPDKVRFLLWRRAGRVVAFALCFIEDDVLYGEYLGLDYSIASERPLYHLVMRDVVKWAIDNGFRALVSTSLNYMPKYQMRHRLLPLDLYVHHTSRLLNPVLRRVLPFLEPTRYDKTLKLFPNYSDLHR